MPVLDWLKNLAPGSAPGHVRSAAPSSRVIVAPPDVSGQSGNGGKGGNDPETDPETDPEDEPKAGATEEDADPDADPDAEPKAGATEEEDEPKAVATEEEDEQEEKPSQDPEKGKDTKMTTTASPAADKPATITELKAAFVGETDFIMECAERSLTLRDAKGAFVEVLTDRNTKLTQQLADKDKAIKGLGNQGLSSPPVSVAPPGVKVVRAAATMGGGGQGGQGGQGGHGGQGGQGAGGAAARIDPARLRRQGDAFGDYDTAVREYEDRGASTAQAYRQVAIDYPELHNKWGAANGKAYTEQRSIARAARMHKA